VREGVVRDRCLVVGGLSAPPVRNAVESLVAAGWDVTVATVPEWDPATIEAPSGARIIRIQSPFRRWGVARRFAQWVRLALGIRVWAARYQPRLTVAIMHRALAIMPNVVGATSVACIYDIPAVEFAGRMDRQLIRRGWRKLKTVDVVWASDEYKAELARRCGSLAHLPLVCHNCPPLSYLPCVSDRRDPWLREQLRAQGASLSGDGGLIVLRAGAIGEAGGIEEMLSALCDLPDDHVFLMIGRPTERYYAHLSKRICSLGLQRRAFIWNAPSDLAWKKALLGADVGHLVHGPFHSPHLQREFELNSSLSNNRLFQYMAAGLPILSYDDQRLGGLHRDVRCFRVLRIGELVRDSVDALRELGMSPRRRREMGLAARQAHVEKYHWERQFSQVLDTVGHGCKPTEPVYV
jgi:glycosyltransferase involved in cell wall biosynthesis